MSKDRIIHLLNDEEISYILTGLRLLEQSYLKYDNTDTSFIQALFDKIDNSLDMGVINDERI